MFHNIFKDLKLTPYFLKSTDEKSMALKSMAAQRGTSLLLTRGTSLLLTNFEKLFVTWSVRSRVTLVRSNASISSIDEAISLFKQRRRRKNCFDPSLGAVCDKYTGSPPIVYQTG